MRREAENSDGEDDDGPGVAMLGSPGSDLGPFDEEAFSGEEEYQDKPPEPSKKIKRRQQSQEARAIEDEEALALRLLSGS